MSVPGMRRSEPLSRHSQFGVGGPADWFVKLHDEQLLAELVQRCSRGGVPLTVIGAGSNTLIRDGGIRGVVVRIDEREMVMEPEAVVLGAGAMLPRVALDCAKHGLAGLEFGIGVPGTCGASVYGNAGAFGTEMRDVLIDCTALSPQGDVVTLQNADCGFAYRFSRFKSDLAGHVVLQARLRVQQDDPAMVRERTDAIQRQRKATQPYGVRSLGSVFKNPADDKAGRLVEAAGLKGTMRGGAQISPKHANFIVNLRHASAEDVLQLAQLAHDAVLEQFGVDLEREIIVLGEPATVMSAG